MTTPTIRVIDWSALSTIGDGRDDFARAVGRGERSLGRLAVSADGGTDRLSAIALRTAGDLLSGHPVADPEWARRTAIVLGTSTGSLPRLVEMAYDSHTGRRGHDVRPMSISSMVPNAAAGRLAIAHAISGPNTTVAAGRLSGLHAMTVAARFLRSGHADRAIVGAVDEVSRERLLGERATRTPTERAARPAAEGCALALLERVDGASGTSGVAFVGARYGSVGDAPSGIAEALAELTVELLSASGVPVAAVHHASLSHHEAHPLGVVEREGLERALGRVPEDRLVVSDLIGDTYSAAAAFQVVAALAGGSDHSVVTVVGDDGEVAVALLRHTVSS